MTGGQDPSTWGGFGWIVGPDGSADYGPAAGLDPDPLSVGGYDDEANCRPVVTYCPDCGPVVRYCPDCRFKERQSCATCGRVAGDR